MQEGGQERERGRGQEEGKEGAKEVRPLGESPDQPSLVSLTPGCVYYRVKFSFACIYPF